LALIAAILGAVTMARSRRLTALALSGALAVLLVEAGVHSVHHLGNQSHSTHCVHATAAPHLVGPLSVPEGNVAALRRPGDRVASRDRDTVRTWSRRPDTARSPPSLSSPA